MNMSSIHLHVAVLELLPVHRVGVPIVCSPVEHLKCGCLLKIFFVLLFGFLLFKLRFEVLRNVRIPNPL